MIVEKHRFSGSRCRGSGLDHRRTAVIRRILQKPFKYGCHTSHRSEFILANDIRQAVKNGILIIDHVAGFSLLTGNLRNADGCTSLSIMSYNFRGFNALKSIYIKTLLVNATVLFLQEHWLSDDQLRYLEDTDDGFFVYWRSRLQKHRSAWREAVWRMCYFCGVQIWKPPRNSNRYQ
jgi:hypothetical protein